MDAANVVLDDNTITSHVKRIRRKFQSSRPEVRRRADGLRHGLSLGRIAPARPCRCDSSCCCSVSPRSCCPGRAATTRARWNRHCARASRARCRRSRRRSPPRSRGAPTCCTARRRRPRIRRRSFTARGPAQPAPRPRHRQRQSRIASARRIPPRRRVPPAPTRLRAPLQGPTTSSRWRSPPRRCSTATPRTGRATRPPGRTSARMSITASAFSAASTSACCTCCSRCTTSTRCSMRPAPTRSIRRPSATACGSDTRIPQGEEHQVFLAATGPGAVTARRIESGRVRAAERAARAARARRVASRRTTATGSSCACRCRCSAAALACWWMIATRAAPCR